MREMLEARAEAKAVAALALAEVFIDDADYDNWDGGTYFWELGLRIRPHEFALLTEAEIQAISDAVLRAAKELASGLRAPLALFG